MKLILLALLFSTNAYAFMGLDGKVVDFVAHTEDRPFGSYLTMNVSFGEIKTIFDTVKKTYKLPLKNREEAHITVITPPEYDKVLKSLVTIQEITKIAKAMKIQESRFNTICLGKGEANLKGKKAHTFYVVVESAALLKIRNKIQQLYVKRGGDKSKFLVDKFYPHITVGFTPRDLHESDGVIKDKKSCIADVPLF
jgi:2'-5' RNA ligase